MLDPQQTPAASDLSEQDLRARTQPSLAPDAGEPAREEQAERDMLGRSPDPEEETPMADRVPGTPGGPGAVGEHTTGGGSAGSEAGVETGARGADTRDADPARQAGEGAGTHRGPEAREDEPLREDLPEKD